ncbi:MAG: hypothetical protein R3212_08170, partial [Xanthomonadales bacterium]|nr:hypothetical protein [Xanthomonadales bacterium]
MNRALVAGVSFLALSLAACAQETGEEPDHVPAATLPDTTQSADATSEQPEASPELTESQQKAYDILMDMANFLAGREDFSVSVIAGFDVVQDNG